MKDFEAKVDKYAPTDYEQKYMKINKYTYDVMVNLHYDVIICSNAARRVEWYLY